MEVRNKVLNLQAKVYQMAKQAKITVSEATGSTHRTT